MTVLLNLFFTAFCFSSLIAQDSIVLKNQTVIVGSILEITSTSIKYINFDQPDGPTRSVHPYEVSKIIYQNEKIEIFNVKVPVTIKESLKPKKIKKTPDPLVGSGFFIEFNVGSSEYIGEAKNVYLNNLSYPIGYYNFTKRFNPISLGINFGTKWYFGKREKWHPGIQLTWLKTGIYYGKELPTKYEHIANTFGFGHVGLTNIFKLSNRIGIETSQSIGPIYGFGTSVTYSDLFGFGIGIDAKIRVNKFAIGAQYMHASLKTGSEYKAKWQIFGLLIGFKIN